MSDCGCCEGLGPDTPAPIDNRPGLPAIAYRAGTFAQFKTSMLAALSSAARPSLRDLATREEDDFSIALVDSWATVCDVLTFYEERAANESYLRTATERLSLLELARLIGYELRPGVSATAQLAFELEQAPGAPPRATIAAGVPVMSVPAPDELPQTFETAEELMARPVWNVLRPRRRRPQGLAKGMKSITLAGMGLNVKPGDDVLVVVTPNGKQRALRTAVNVTEDAQANTTRIDFTTTPARPRRHRASRLPAATITEQKLPLTDDVIRSLVLERTWDAADLLTFATTQEWPLDELSESVSKLLATAPARGDAGAWVFRTRAAIFGHNAPAWGSLPAVLRYGERTTDASGAQVVVAAAYPTSWENRTLADDAGTNRFVYLDNTYPKLVKGGWIALVHPGKRASYRIEDSVDTSRSDFTINAKVTRLTMDRDAGFHTFSMRGTSVRGESQRLALADVPITDPVEGARISLDGFHPELQPGRSAILEGEPVDLPGVRVREVLRFERVTIEGGYTVLALSAALGHRYLRTTVTINANIALATMGESKQEVLGSGDASQPYQRFVLRQPPLTHVSAPTATGSESTLEVRVDGVLWHEAPTLYGLGPNDRVYITRLDASGNTSVEFGDGRTGARLPTGAENVAASYRKGIGLGGLVDAGQLSLLVRRPPSVKAVANPLPAEGAADPEHEDEARRNAPLRVLTLDRVVSLEDFEDFASAFAGLAKALATSIWDPRGNWVLLTIAGPGGAIVQPGSELAVNLTRAIVDLGDVGARFELRAFRPALFEVGAKLAVDPEHLAERVLAAADGALRTAFSFDSRSFGAPVAQSEVEAVLQDVDGVVGVDLDTLARVGRPASEPDLSPRLWATVPQSGDVPLLGAELLTIDPRRIRLSTFS
jgi:predicted phage baseplate assembly protein